MFARVRYKTPLGGWGQEIYSIAMKDGKITNVAANWPVFPGTPEWNSMQAFGDHFKAIAKGDIGKGRPQPARAAAKAKGKTAPNDDVPDDGMPGPPRPSEWDGSGWPPGTDLKTYAIGIGPNRVALYRKAGGQWKFQGYAERLTDKAALEEIKRARIQEEGVLPEPEK